MSTPDLIEVEMEWKEKLHLFLCAYSADPGEPMTRDHPGSPSEFILETASIQDEKGSWVDVTDELTDEELKHLEDLAEQKIIDEEDSSTEDYVVDWYLDGVTE